MGFQFSLETLLRFRDGLERREYLALQRLQQAISALQNQLQQIRQAASEEQHLYRELLAKGVEAAELQSSLIRQQQHRQLAERCQEQLVQLEHAHEQQLAIYNSARQNRELLSELRDRQSEAYSREQDRNDQKQMDDLFLGRLPRQQ